MRKLIVLIVGLAILAIANYAIYDRELLLTEGRVVLLELAPEDPRSLMQGDYMALDFKAAESIPVPSNSGGGTRDGHIIVRLDKQGIGNFAHLDCGEKLESNEVRIRYRIRDRVVRLATNAFFFQEGDSSLYEDARYGEFRVGVNGDAILTGMRNRTLEPLGKKRIR
jgi:uncharacterized membrane-anchored protein